MAYTFYDMNSNPIEIIDGDTKVETNSDIESKKITGYFVVVNDQRIEVTKKTYEAVEEYLS